MFSATEIMSGLAPSCGGLILGVALCWIFLLSCTLLSRDKFRNRERRDELLFLAAVTIVGIILSVGVEMFIREYYPTGPSSQYR